MREVQIFPHIPENLAFGAGNFPLANEALLFAARPGPPICELPRNLAYARITRISNNPPCINKKYLPNLVKTS